MGGIQWEHSFGGTVGEFAYSIKQTTDGGYVFAGRAVSTNGDVTGNHGNDYWVVKLDSSGLLKWAQCYGGSGADIARSIEQTTDGGFIVVGYSNSVDGDVTGNHGNYDYWLVKLENPSAIKEIISENDFIIYPNPSSDLINIDIRHIHDKNITIKITDVLGNIVKQKRSITENTSIDLSNLQNGIYFVQVKTNEGLLTKKIAVAK